jgi:putative FmdB family regulatory protein
MPIYEYECGSCGHRFEAIQKMSDPVLKDCPSCGQSGLKKLISAAGFQLKGTGWYATDFKGGGQKKDGHKKENPSDSSDTTPPKKKAGGCGGGGCGCAH